MRLASVCLRNDSLNSHVYRKLIKSYKRIAGVLERMLLIHVAYHVDSDQETVSDWHVRKCMVTAWSAWSLYESHMGPTPTVFS